MSDKILIVDDEPDILEIIEFRAQEAGFDTMTAANGRIAFKLAQAGDFKCILTDIRMSDGDGIELLKNIISTLGAQPPVILMSGHLDLKNKELKELGAVDILRKPLDFERLFQLIRDLTNH